MKRYKVIVRTEHEWTDIEIREWMEECTNEPKVAWTFSITQRRQIFEGKTVKVAEDELGTTFIKATRIK